MLALDFAVLQPALFGRRTWGEEFVARHNRAREWREGALRLIAAMVRPRWAYALTGSAIILFSLALLDGGAQGMGRDLPMTMLWRARGAEFGALGAALVLAGGLATGDWRSALALALSSVLAGGVAAWLSVHAGQPVTDAAPLSGLALGAASSGGLVMLSAIAAYRRFGDEVDLAFSRALGDCAAAILAAGAAFALTALALAPAFPAARTAAIFAGAAMLVALLLAPLFLSILHDLFPPRRSMEELYGAR
jgi:hypothetical protein